MRTPTDGEALQLGECVRSTPRVVWALVLLFAGLMALYSVGVPIYHGPDELKHVDMLFAVSEPGGWPAQYEREISEQVMESSRALGYAPGRGPRAADEAVPPGQRPSFAELGSNEPSGIRNQMWQHPPLAYVTLATVLSVVTAMAPPVAGWSSDQIVGLARLLAALLVAPLPLLAFWATRRLAGRQGPAAWTAAIVALAVPGAAHIGATVTNDGLLIALIGLLTVALVYVATGDLSMRTAVIAGAVAGLALLTKGFALFVPAWIPAAYGLAAVRAGRARWVRAGIRGAIALAVAAAVGGWWWVRNLLVLGTIQPSATPLRPAPDDFVPSLAHWLSVISNLTTRSFWGNFGWVEAPLPWPVVWIATGVLAVAVVGAFAARRPGDAWSRADVGLLLVPLIGCAAIMAYGGWRFYAYSGQTIALHGRYLMAGMVGMAGVAGLGLTALARRVAGSAWLPIAVLGAAAALHLTGFLAILERFWMAEGAGYREGLTSLLAWSPWPPRVVAAPALMAAAAAVWALVELLVTGRGRPPARTAQTAGRADVAGSTPPRPPAPAPPRR